MTTSLLAWTCLSLPLTGALDAEADKPHLIRIVLLVAENRALTPLFRSQLERSVGARLQQRLGPSARVDVVATHPLAGAIEGGGLEVLDTWDETGTRQLCFVLVNLHAGRYDIRTRSYDGWNAVAGPVIRRAQTSDRSQVAARALELLEQDVSPVGTVTRVGKDVEVTLRGGAVTKAGSDEFDQRVRGGSVFAVSRVRGQGDEVKAAAIPWVLLEALGPPANGTVRCRLWRRYAQDDLEGEPGVAGYRCVLVPTIQGPVRVRVLDQDTAQPLSGLHVTFIQPRSKIKAEATTDRDGLAAAAGPFQHFVLMQASLGARILAQVPIALVDDRVIECRLKIDPGAEQRAALELRRDQWLRRLYDNLRVAAERTPELNLLLGKSLEAARDHARRGLSHLDGELERLVPEYDLLKRHATDKQAGSLDLQEGEQRLAELQRHRAELVQFVKRLEETIQEAKSERSLAVAKLLERARLLEQNADFDQAIQLYEKVLEASPEQSKVKAQLDKLRAAWTPKSPRHAQAREFLLQTWPRIDWKQLADKLKQAEEALEVCREAGDRLTPLRLQQSNTLHVAELKRQLEALKRQNTEESRLQLKRIAQVAEGLRRLHAAAEALSRDSEK